MLWVEPGQSGKPWHGARWQPGAVGRQLRALLHRLCLPRATFVGVSGADAEGTARLCELVLQAGGPCRRALTAHGAQAGMVDAVLATTRRDDFFVAPLPVTHPGAIDAPLRLLRPHIAVLTGAQHEPRGAFGSQSERAAEAAKLVAALPPDGTAVVDVSDPLLRAIGERFPGRVLRIGHGPGADLRLRAIRSAPPEPLTLHVQYRDVLFEVRTGLQGRHMAVPTLAALGTGLAAGLPLDTALAALAGARPAEGRMELVQGADGVSFVRDDRHATDASLARALAYLGEARAQRRVAVIGSLADAGRASPARHARAAREALAVADVVVFVGPDALQALRAADPAEPQSFSAFTDLRAAAHYLRTELRPGDLVLVSGCNDRDHLARLILDREQPIRCWREDCTLARSCCSCPQLRAKAVAPQAAAGAIAPVPGKAAAVVVGLGHPGLRHRGTPYNAGRRLIEDMARAARSEWQAHPEGLATTVVVEHTPVTLFLPDAAPSESGPALRDFLRRTGEDARRCLLVHDDLDVALGDVRFKRGGGDAGHRGVRSVIVALGTHAIERIRIGVRPPGAIRSGRTMVLARLAPEQEALLAAALAHGAAVLRSRVPALAGRPATIAPLQGG